MDKKKSIWKMRAIDKIKIMSEIEFVFLLQRSKLNRSKRCWKSIEFFPQTKFNEAFFFVNAEFVDVWEFVKPNHWF